MVKPDGLRPLELIDRPKISVFTGAGASATFEFPTTGQFYRQVKNGIGENLPRFWTYLEEFGQSRSTLDAEFLIAVADIFQNLIEERKRGSISPSLGIFFYEKMFQAELNRHADSRTKEFISKEYLKAWSDTGKRIADEAKFVANSLKHEVYKTYTGALSKTFDIATVYKPLIELLIGFGNPQIEVFTSNYDRSFETPFIEKHPIFADFKIKFEHGFPSELPSIWSDSNYTSPASHSNFECVVRYYKLHGSVNWKTRPDGRVAYNEQEDNNSEIENLVLLFPGFKGKPVGQPFAYNHLRLSESLHISDIFLFIEFTFRDQYINELVRDAVIRNPRLRLILITDKDEDSLLNELESDDSLIPWLIENNKLSIIDSPFGDNRCISEVFSLLEQFKMAQR